MANPAEAQHELPPLREAADSGRATKLRPEVGSRTRPFVPFLSPDSVHSDAFPFVQFGLDGIALVLGWFTTIHVRLWLNGFFTSKIPPSQAYHVAPALGGMLTLWVIASVWLRIYRRRDDLAVAPALSRVADSTILMSALAIIATFFSRSFGAETSRSFVLVFAPVSFFYLVCSLYLAPFAVLWVEKLRGPKRVAVLGSGNPATDVIDSIQQSRFAAVQLTGLIVPDGLGAGLGGCMLPVLGSTKQLAEVINRERLDRIIVAGDSITADEMEKCRTITKRMGVVISRPIQRAQPDSIANHRVRQGIHYLELTPVPFTQGQEIAKRVLDIVAACFLVLLLSPLLLVIALLVKSTSHGPIFFKSPRVGRGGRYFTFWKFRSMYAGLQSRAHVAKENEKRGHLFKIRKDPRVTPVGRVLRRWSLDELPQLLNVLIGDMSLVGPRPLPAEDMDPDGLSREYEVWAEARSRVRPGITGLWQIRGRSDLDFEQLMQYDIQYVNNWSLSLDIRILLETPLVVVSGRGAC